MSVRGFVWVLLGVTGCGSVSESPSTDAPSNIDASLPANADPGSIRWARSLSSLQGLGIADGPGGLVVTGTLTTPADLGGGTLTPSGGGALVVAGYSADDASHLYSVKYGDVGNVFPFLHALNPAGAPIVNGVSYGDVDLGKGKVAGGSPGVTENVPADGYIGLYGPGTPRWVARIAGTGEDKIVATALGPGSTVYGAGWYAGTPTFNGVALPTSRDRDLFLARFDMFSGAVQLTRTYGGTGRDEISSAARAGDAVIVAGMFDDTLAFGGSTAPITSGGALDVFVAKLDASGNGVWAVRYGGAGDDRDPRVVVDGAGDVYIAGSFTNQIAFGAVNLVAHGATDVDVFVVKLRGTDGTVAWATSFGSAAGAAGTTGTDGVLDLAVDAAGHVALSGSLGGSLDGKATAGGVDALVASFEAATGAMRWHDTYSTEGNDYAFALTYGRNGDVYAVVNVAGPYAFGVPVIGAANPSSVVLRIAP
jgi:hypothetical protein